MWELNGVIRVAQDCIILDNFAVKMKHNGAFRNETCGEDLISEVYDRDETAEAEAGSKYEAYGDGIRQKATMNSDEQDFRWFVKTSNI